MPQPGIRNRAVLILGFGLLAVSIASVFIKLCYAPALVIAAYRLTIASVFYIGFTGFKQGPFWGNLTKAQLKISLISGLFLTLHFATWITSLKYTSVASSVVLVQSSPIFVAVGSIIFLKEKPSFLLVIGIIVALVGTIIISVSDFALDQNSLTGNILAVGGAIGAAGYLLAGRKLRAEIDTFRYVTVVYTITAVLLILMAIINGDQLFNYSGKIYVLLFAIAIFPQIIGHTSINWSLEHFSATTVSIFILGEPIGASILALIILGEKLAIIKVIGGIIIICGVLLALLAESQTGTREKTAAEN